MKGGVDKQKNNYSFVTLVVKIGSKIDLTKKFLEEKMKKLTTIFKRPCAPQHADGSLHDAHRGTHC